MNTPRIGAPELVAGQDVPETTVNEIVRYLEQGGGNFFVVVAKGTNSPPGSPVDSDAHIIGSSPSGAWSSFTPGRIAFLLEGSWKQIPVYEGTHAFSQADNALYYNDGSGGLAAWVDPPAAFTNEKVDDRVNALLLAGDGLTKTYDDGAGTLTIDWDGGAVNVGTPAEGEVLTWDDAAGEWVAAPAPGSGGGSGGTVPNGGTTGQVLVKQSNADQDVTWGFHGFSGAKVKKSANLTAQNLTTPANITFNSEDYDTAAYHDTGSNTDRLTPPSAGFYLVHGLLELANVTSGNYCRILLERYNSGGVLQEYIDIQMMEASVTGTFHWSASGVAQFAAGDYAVMKGHVESDTSVDITTTTRFSIARLGA